MEGTNEGCDVDATDTLHCVPAGTYFIKVFNSNENPYILKTTCIEPGTACPIVVVENQHCAGPCEGSLYNGGITEYQLYVPLRYIITDINVRVNILHGRDQDLTIWLRSPYNTQVELSSRNGGDGMNYTNTVFDDEASSSIICTNTSCAPFTGTYRPEQSLSNFDGQNAQGVWTLRINDINSLQAWTNDTGSVYCWCLEFDYDTILAVQLNSFDLSSVDNGIKLQWETAYESGNSYFEIQRDGVLLTEVASRGNPQTVTATNT
ncbi:MAG: proprotein convertase P-domain-containing protein [bacterium]|nr:proprotein convertase P-domain-containing protein [bacterium]